MPLTAKVAVNPLPWVLGPHGFDLSPTTVRAAVAGIAARPASPRCTRTCRRRCRRRTTAPCWPTTGSCRRRATSGRTSTGRPKTSRPWSRRRRPHAATQLELGLTEAFLASHLNPARIARPAVGADFDADRLDLVIERIALVAGAVRGEGLTPCFHPHVGSWIETEHEVRTMLDTVDASVLSFGPDTGHLFWGGSDPAKVIADYADRVGAMHLKDVHRINAERAEEQADDYQAATNVEHVWSEPGRGDVDFAAVFAALPASYDGWFVVEVDVPDLPTKEESTVASAQWIASRPELGSGSAQQ